MNIISKFNSIDAHVGAGRIDIALGELKFIRELLGSEFEDKLNMFGLRIPKILIVGPARTGTTWLKTVIGSHPDVSMARGEPNVLWQIGRGKLADSLAWYGRSDIWRGAAKERAIISEKSPGYISLTANIIAILHTLQPELKIIVGHRDEKQRLWSFINHRMRTVGFENSWKEFCLQHKQEVADEIENGKIDYHLCRWLLFLPEHNIKVVDFPDISSNAHSMVDDLLEHVQVRSITSLTKIEQDAVLRRLLSNPNPGPSDDAPVDFIEEVFECIRPLD